MTERDPVQEGAEHALFLLAEKRQESVFDELIEYATDVCLHRPPAYLLEGESSRYETTHSEHSLVQDLGARGLSTLIELDNGVHPLNDDNYQPKFHISEVLEVPKEYTGTVSLRILENAERFGQRLIDESFTILGKDAAAWVEKLKNAKTSEDELSVINWLDRRIEAISAKSRSQSSQEDEAEHFYPPYRISPKFIGEYPSLSIQPSCLSASIIATSFFQRAGIPTLHAGVTTPANEAGTELLLATLKTVFSEDPTEEDQAAQKRIEALWPLLKTGKQWTERPLAQHGAVYAKLPNSWVQFDAYYNATVVLSESEGEHLNFLHESLEHWKPIIPNLEISTSIQPDRALQLYSKKYASLSFILSKAEHPDKEAAIETISDALRTIPDESASYYLYELCVKSLLSPQNFSTMADKDEMLSDIIDESLSEVFAFTRQPNGAYDSRLFRLFDNALREHVRWGDSPEEFIEKCTKDPAYRRRRAEDFLLMPKIMAVFNAQLIAQNDLGFSHIAVDVGNPAMRIGLATLSDFARYDDHPLPGSFWVSHWPGAVSIIENLDNPPANKFDTVVTYNALLSKLVHPFTSMHNYDKINSFLSLYGRQDDDGGQEGSGQSDPEGRTREEGGEEAA